MAINFIDNINCTLKDDLEEELKGVSEIDLIANKFSIYAYEK